MPPKAGQRQVWVLPDNVSCQSLWGLGSCLVMVYSGKDPEDRQCDSAIEAEMRIYTHFFEILLRFVPLPAPAPALGLAGLGPGLLSRTKKNKKI